MTDWYIRDAEGRIIGHRPDCAYPGCARTGENGSPFCATHDAEFRLHCAADRQGWGIRP